MLWIATFFSVILVTYSLLILYYVTGIRDPGTPDLNSPGAKLSLVVPYRNEEAHIRTLVEQLKAQDYPAENFRVLLVNDHSTDGSAQLARELTGGDDRFRLLDLPRDRAGKKAAVRLAVEHADHDWILQTDADCRFGKDFIRAHMSVSQSGPADLVAGMVSAGTKGDGFLNAFECLDLLALSGVAAGSFARGRPLMCSAANLRYRKQLYLDTRSYDPEGKFHSGDDMFLMIGARKLNRPSAFMTDPASLVLTVPVRNPAELFRQRVRWGGKTPGYRMPGIQFVALLAVLAAAGAMLFPLWMVSRPEAWWIWMAAPAGKFLSDLAMLRRMTGLTGQRRMLRWFLPAWAVHQPFLLATALASLATGTTWKDRRAPSRSK